MFFCNRLSHLPHKLFQCHRVYIHSRYSKCFNQLWCTYYGYSLQCKHYHSSHINLLTTPLLSCYQLSNYQSQSTTVLSNIAFAFYVRLCSGVGAILIRFVLYLLRAHLFYCGCCGSIPNQLSCVFLRIMCECLDSKHLDEFILQFCTTGSMYSWAYQSWMFPLPLLGHSTVAVSSTCTFVLLRLL